MSTIRSIDQYGLAYFDNAGGRYQTLGEAQQANNLRAMNTASYNTFLQSLQSPSLSSYSNNRHTYTPIESHYIDRADPCYKCGSQAHTMCLSCQEYNGCKHREPHTEEECEECRFVKEDKASFLWVILVSIISIILLPFICGFWFYIILCAIHVADFKSGRYSKYNRLTEWLPPIGKIYCCIAIPVTLYLVLELALFIIRHQKS